METRQYDGGCSSRNLVFLFLSGALLGAGLALLLAPQAGPEARRTVRGYAQQTGETLLGVARDARVNAATVVEQGKGLLAEGTRIVGAAYESGKDAVRRTKEG